MDSDPRRLIATKQQPNLIVSIKNRTHRGGAEGAE
jgi:hypothetical protein